METTDVWDAPGPAGPGWLADWRSRPLGAAGALARFDALPAIEPDKLMGRWRGAGLVTGHPLDGLLESLGWHGKAFAPPREVHPLLFRCRSGVVALDPALIPVGWALGMASRWPRLARSAVSRAAFSALRPLLRARRPVARLHDIRFRGRTSAAIVYDRQPIIDHLRRIDEGRVLGLMETRGNRPPYFFLLVSEDGGTDFP